MPGFVSEDGISADAADLDSHGLEFFVMMGQVLELGRTHEGEIGRIEEENQPFFTEIGQTRFFESFLMEYFEVEIRNFLSDHRKLIPVASAAATHIILHKIFFNFFRGYRRVPPGFFLVKQGVAEPVLREYYAREPGIIKENKLYVVYILKLYTQEICGMVA